MSNEAKLGADQDNLPPDSLDKKLQDLLEKVLSKTGLPNEMSDEQISALEDGVNRFLSEYLSMMYSLIKQDSKQRLREIKTKRRDFKSKLQKHWGSAIDLLEVFTDLSVSVGSEFNNNYRSEAAKEQDHKFEVLSRLHARACLVAHECLSLLRSGYALGAYSRWRTVYETSIISRFIAQNDDALAEAFLLNSHIDSYKVAKQYKAAFEAASDIFIQAGYKPLSHEEFQELEKTYSALVVRYGEHFQNAYGWANTVLSMKSPRFGHIEGAVSQDHLHPFYDLASYGIHASPKSAVFNIAIPTQQSNTLLLTGCSVYGLADAGAGTAISLNVVNAMLLQQKNLLEHKARLEVLDKLVEEICTAFADCHFKLEPQQDT